MSAIANLLVADTLRIILLGLIGLLVGVKGIYLWTIIYTRNYRPNTWDWLGRLLYFSFHVIVFLGLAESIASRVDSGIPLQVVPFACYVVGTLGVAILLLLGIREERELFHKVLEIEHEEVK